MKRTDAARWVASVLTSVALAGCGGGGGGGSGSAPAPTPAPPSSTADVDVAITASAASVREGDDVSYTITVRNVGAETARDVLLTLDFGSNQALQGVDCRASSGAACPLQTGAQMVLPSLAAGGQLVFTVPVTLALGTAPAGAGASITARAGADARAANNSASVSVAATERSWVRLQSDGNDPVGGGSTFTYTRSSAQLAVTANGNLLTIAVRGDQTWEGQFQLPNSATQLQVGTYPSLTRYPNHAPAVGGLSWTGTSSVCFQVRGTLSVTRAIYVAGVLSELDLSFEQTCDGATGALRGALRWRAGDTTQPPGPVNPPPASLWAPAPGVTPASGDYVYLESEAGDFIGGGGTYSFTRANALLSIAMSGARLQIGVAAGQVGFNGSFLPMNTVMALQPGYYPNLQYPVINPVRGSLEVSGNGRGCNRTKGWVAIDRVSFNAGQLSELELRFEQRCDGATAALRGKLRLTGNDTTVPPGPVQPPPAGLWTPPAGAVPPTGDFIYLQSDASDFIGRGRTHSYSRANARLLFMSSPGLFSVSIDGDEWWNGDFKAMSTLTRLAPGYYGDLQRYPFHNQVKGGLSWFGQSRACNQLSGWFVVDSASYSGDTLTAITLRFEQRCENGAAALRGLVRMTVGDATTPPGPVNPPPANLWAPAPGATPASGDYVYLESDSTDFIAQGRSYTYTRANAQLTFSAPSAAMSVRVEGDERWNGEFSAMDGLPRLQPGYYGDLQRFPFSNPAKGGLGWAGEGRVCNTLAGWFVVDSVSYSGSTLTAIELRFSQTCGGAAGALRGKVRLTPNDTTQPPGPVNPPPADLWSPPAGALPPSGNAVYLQSQPGDSIGQGRTWLHTDATSRLTVTASGAGLTVDINGDTFWRGEFQPMSSLTRMERGYYGDLRRLPFHNRVKGGLSWWGNGAGCNALSGWFVVDDVTYDSAGLVSITLRFVQRCEAGPSELRGVIRWAR
jgi:hypothetical protein